MQLFQKKIVWLIVGVLLLELGSVFFLPLDVPNNNLETSLTLSQFQGEESLGIPAHMVASNKLNTLVYQDLCQSFPLYIWQILLLFFWGLLLFNFLASYTQNQKITGKFEFLIGIFFLVEWFFYDSCREFLWFPITLVQSGLLLYILATVLAENKKLRKGNT